MSSQVECYLYKTCGLQEKAMFTRSVVYIAVFTTCCDVLINLAGTATATINGAPPSMLSPTAVASFQVPPANGQAAEVYANGIPHYTGENRGNVQLLLNPCACFICAPHTSLSPKKTLRNKKQQTSVQTNLSPLPQLCSVFDTVLSLCICWCMWVLW